MTRVKRIRCPGCISRWAKRLSWEEESESKEKRRGERWTGRHWFLSRNTFHITARDRQRNTTLILVTIQQCRSHDNALLTEQYLRYIQKAYLRWQYNTSRAIGYWHYLQKIRYRLLTQLLTLQYSVSTYIKYFHYSQNIPLLAILEIRYTKYLHYLHNNIPVTIKF